MRSLWVWTVVLSRALHDGLVPCATQFQAKSETSTPRRPTVPERAIGDALRPRRRRLPRGPVSSNRTPRGRSSSPVLSNIPPPATSSASSRSRSSSPLPLRSTPWEPRPRCSASARSASCPLRSAKYCANALGSRPPSGLAKTLMI